MVGDCRSPDPRLDRNAEPPRRRCVNRRAKGLSAEYANDRALCADFDRGAAGEAGHSCFPSRSLRAAGDHFATSPAALATGMAGLHSAGRGFGCRACRWTGRRWRGATNALPSRLHFARPGFDPWASFPCFKGGHRIGWHRRCKGLNPPRSTFTSARVRLLPIRARRIGHASRRAHSFGPAAVGWPRRLSQHRRTARMVRVVRPESVVRDSIPSAAHASAFRTIEFARRSTVINMPDDGRAPG